MKYSQTTLNEIRSRIQKLVDEIATLEEKKKQLEEWRKLLAELSKTDTE